VILLAQVGSVQKAKLVKSVYRHDFRSGGEAARSSSLLKLVRRTLSEPGRACRG
jgi:hypothetical protein